MTCKDCLHYEVCFALTGNGLPCLDGGCHAEEFCLEFKDKSNFIELPCKVGTNIFCVRTDINEILECVVVRISYFEKPLENEIRYLIKNDIRFSTANFEDIGKTIFLTREEAEKKLKELENGR